VFVFDLPVVLKNFKDGKWFMIPVGNDQMVKIGLVGHPLKFCCLPAGQGVSNIVPFTQQMCLECGKLEGGNWSSNDAQTLKQLSACKTCKW
jgi:hypothetical protein